MGNAFQFAWEIPFIVSLQKIVIMFPALADVAALITMLGEPAFMAIFVGIFYWGFNKKLGRRLAVYIMGTVVLSLYLKNIFLRRRPYFDNKEVICFRPADQKFDVNDIVGQGFSFPSGHATGVSALTRLLCEWFKKKWLMILFTVLVLLVMLSRNILGVHYPTDVLAGAFIGLTFGTVLDKISEKFGNNTMMISLMVFGFTGLFFCKSSDYFTSYGVLCGMICAIMYDDKYVNFENTNKLSKVLIRILFGLVAVVALAELPKFVLPASLTDGGSTLAMIVRTVRYGIAAFVGFGIYPRVFKYKLFK